MAGVIDLMIMPSYSYPPQRTRKYSTATYSLAHFMRELFCVQRCQPARHVIRRSHASDARERFASL
jgi:hypothetical protein